MGVPDCNLAVTPPAPRPPRAAARPRRPPAPARPVADRASPAPPPRSAPPTRASLRPRAPSAPGARSAGPRGRPPVPANRRSTPPPWARAPPDDCAPTAPPAGSSRASGGDRVSSPGGADDENRVLASEVVFHEAVRQVIRHPALAVHDEHVFARPGVEHHGGAPHAVVIPVLQRNRAGAPVVERADHVHGPGVREAPDELRDALVIAQHWPVPRVH